MYPTVPRSRGKLVAAGAVSVGLHVLLGLVWFVAPEGDASSGGPFGTAVDGPDDRETIIVLRDPPSARPPALKTAPARASDPPVPLPPSVVGTQPSPARDGAISRIGHSPPEPESSPKNGGAMALHGPLKPGKSIVYVLDRSSSMGSDGLLKAASAAIKASLAELGPDVRFGLVAYSSRAEAFGSALIPATPENVQRAAAWLDGRRPEGGSRHLAGLQEGVWLRPDVVFMLTDADDLDEREVKSIANLVRNRAHLRVALFGERQTTGETPLGRLVRELGARVQYVGQ